jgi:hypothetical protein
VVFLLGKIIGFMVKKQKKAAADWEDLETAVIKN